MSAAALSSSVAGSPLALPIDRAVRDRAVANRLALGLSQRVRKRRRNDAQCLIRGFNERDVLEATLHLGPVVLELLAHASRVQVEALVQEHEEHQVRLASSECALGELLQEEHTPAASSGLVFEELAQLVDDHEQATGPRPFKGRLKRVHEFQNPAVGHVACASGLADIRDDGWLATSLACPESRRGLVQCHEQTVREGFLAAGQHDAAPRALSCETSRKVWSVPGKHLRGQRLDAPFVAEQFMQKQGERRLARAIRPDQAPRAGLVVGTEHLSDVIEQASATSRGQVGLDDRP